MRSIIPVRVTSPTSQHYKHIQTVSHSESLFRDQRKQNIWQLMKNDNIQFSFISFGVWRLPVRLLMFYKVSLNFHKDI